MGIPEREADRSNSCEAVEIIDEGVFQSLFFFAKWV